MLDPKLMPTRLLEPAEKHPLPISIPEKPSRFRALYLILVVSRLAVVIAWLFLRRRLTRQVFGKRLRQMFESLGGMWIKFGQLLSLRSDIFPREFCVELARLQDQAGGFPTEMARAIIEEDLGLPVDDLFDDFEDAPFAAASVAQLHRAHLRHNGVWVAVKVQRPFLAEAFEREMAFVRGLVAVIRRLWFVPNLHWDEMLWELNQILTEEVDFRYEAASTRRMRKNLRRHSIYVPKVFLRYSSQRVMVSEFVNAVLMADFIRMLHTDPIRVEAWCRENDFDTKVVARRLYNSMWRQMLEDNLFHGDMHPGNIILLRGGHLALIDFGAVGSLEREYQKKYYLLIRAMADLDFAKAADLLFMLSGALPPRDLNEVKQKIIRALRSWEMRSYAEGLPYREKSMTNVANELIKILFQHECSADWSFLRITRAQETLDQSLMHLYPAANYMTLTREYFMKAVWRARRKALQPKALGELLHQVHDAVTLPSRLSENAMFQNWIIRRQAQVFRGSTSKVAHFFSLLFGRLFLVGAATSLFLMFTFLRQYHPSLVPGWIESTLGETMSSVRTIAYPIWLGVLVIAVSLTQTARSLNKQFARHERTKE